ncbi:MAG: PAS domain S-box protein [Nitrospira sp.]
MDSPRTNVEVLRRKAEAYLKKAAESVRPDPVKQDAMTLVHELQVYQIELEMQCEEMRRTQLDLQESRDRYAELYESIPVGYFTFTRQGAIEEINPAGCAMLGRPVSQLRGKRFQLFLPPKDRQVFTNFCRQVIDRKESLSCEVSLSPDSSNDPDEEESAAKMVLIEGRPVRSGEAPSDHLRAAVVDITIRKQAEHRLEHQEAELRASREKLQEMNTKILNVRDEERRVIARELHDDCCQQLALSIITTNSVEQLTAKPVSEKLRTLGTHLKRVLDTIRHVAYGMHPAMWETTGIEEAARNYIEDFTAVTQLPVSFTCRDIPAHLPQTITTCLFRTLQESLHNVVKYARASQIAVDLEKAGDVIRMTVADNGKGFDLKHAQSPSGLGLISMQERVRLLNGVLEIKSEPGKGATIQISLPVAPTR